mmetsp:Transcript_13110/g.31600  ORF Transcript_13110/g.31600 Transcript_13110/m.31600 type:complete len:306 (+) Transcript_13110:62-979(+)|eukprot:CAMPEP_0197613498 /NCGR_PEP_ID=MMETSP1326-20131121/59049_1 /TAXON_ID=1155430 /ORGANISM="Genus nov. species nov., Strain RCC2288" /LENGTH=305 /DNA_ID=CAMNT_0043182361 /DNA_START=78 /DNA_END=995 /DNA_ORIENTATION=-
MASCTASLVAPALRVQQRRSTTAARRSAAPVRTMAAARSVEQMAGTGGLPAVKLTSADGCTATAYLFGGVVTSFTRADGYDVLYVRPDAKFDKTKPISGGLPHCWPQFGPGDIQVHGFARNVDWELTKTTEGASPSVEMTLKPSEYTKAMWDKQFVVTQTITLGDGKLNATMKVSNLGTEAFSFTSSFHTYFAADINAVAVGGMAGCKSLDRLANVEGTVSGDVKIAGPVDSVYYDVPAALTLAVGGGKTVSISSAGGWKDAVVWSPWTDMEACYKEFVCVENAACAAPVVVAPGASWSATTILA